MSKAEATLQLLADQAQPFFFLCVALGGPVKPRDPPACLPSAVFLGMDHYCLTIFFLLKEEPCSPDYHRGKQGRVSTRCHSGRF